MTIEQTTSFESATGAGVRLKKAREAAGLSIDAVAGQLRMPAQVVRSLEDEQWQRLGAPVFVRGQLRSYARLLKVELGDMLDTAGIAPVVPPDLVSHTHTPKLRRVVESVGRKALYVGITCVLAVPVWFASRSHFEDRPPSTASLDAVPAAVPVPDAREPGEAVALPASPSAAPATAPAARGPAQPFVASMTPLPPAASRPAPAAGLSLAFKDDSWVEITAPDGSTVEKALIRAGEQRSFQPGQVGRMVLGNATAVEVQQGGSIVDLTPFRRANVARFAVSSEGSVISAPH